MILVEQMSVNLCEELPCHSIKHSVEDRCLMKALKYLTRIFFPLQPRLLVVPINLLQDSHLLGGGLFQASAELCVCVHDLKERYNEQT